MRSKPEWKNAPDRFNWLAQDRDGDWYWWEQEPVHDEENLPYWMPANERPCDFARARLAGEGIFVENWKDTLEARP